MNRLIVSLIGNPNCGKSTAAEHLVEKYGFISVRPSNIIRNYALANGLSVGSRSEYRDAYLQMVDTHGSEHVRDRILEAPGQLVCVDGPKCPQDIDKLHDFGSTAVSVALWCPIETRYKRSLDRKRDIDPTEFTAFSRNEAEEYQSAAPPYVNVMHLMQTADHHIDASGHLNEVVAAVDEVVEPFVAQFM